MHAPLALAAGLALAAAAGPARAADPAPRPPRNAPAVDALVRKAVEAFGGKAAFARSAVRREQGTVTSLLHPGDVGEIARVAARPGRLRVEVAYPGGSREVRVLDGGRGWRDGQEASGPRLQAMMLQAARLDVVAQLADPTRRVEARGEAVVNGVAVRVLAFAPAPELLLEVHVDPRSGRVLRTRGFAGGPHVPAAFETTYGEFRKVDGVLVAFHEWNWANGRSTGETVLTRVEFPREPPPGAFAP